MDNQVVLYSSSQVWQGYSPDELPLNIEILKKEEVGNIIYTHLYIDGSVGVDGTSKVYCVTACKLGITRAPSIVFLNSLGKGIDYNRLNNWASRGYFIIQVDNRGATENEKYFSIYPSSMEYANATKYSIANDKCLTNARQTCWYQWVINSRRAISYLFTLSEVDTSNIGMYAVGRASNIVLQTLATDDRLKTGAVLYGNLRYEVSLNDKLELLSNEELTAKLQENDERQRYVAGVCPQSYLSLIKKPFYVCMGTNSVTTDMDRVHEAAFAINNNKSNSVFLVPRMQNMGQITDRHNLDLWFKLVLEDNVVATANPHSKVYADNGKLYVKYDFEHVVGSSKVEYFYCRNSAVDKCVRNWVAAKQVENGVFEIEVYDKKAEILLFCNVTLKQGLRISSKIIKINPSEYEVTLNRQTKILYSGKQGVAEFVPLSLTAEMSAETIDNNPVTSVSALYAIDGIACINMATAALTDNKYVFDLDSVINFDAYTPKAQRLTISLLANCQSERRVYSYGVELLGGNFWQKVTIAIRDFKQESGKIMKDGEVLQVLHFSSRETVVLNNILFS